MTKLRVLIVDDEPLARDRIRNLLAARTDIEVLADCRDAFEAISAIRKHAPDLVFLDVQMPEKDGFEVLEEIGAENMPAVIFVTAYDQYAVRAFDVHALDYLLKPFDADRFEQALSRACSQIQNGQPPQINHRMLSLMEEWAKRSGYMRRILVKRGERMTLLDVKEIDWIKAEGNYVRLHSGKSSSLLRETISHLETQLDPQMFLRIHRSAIVRVGHIKEIQQLFHGDYRVVLQDGTKLPLSRTYRSRLPRTADED